MKNYLYNLYQKIKNEPSNLKHILNCSKKTTTRNTLHWITQTQHSTLLIFPFIMNSMISLNYEQCFVLFLLILLFFLELIIGVFIVLVLWTTLWYSLVRYLYPEKLICVEEDRERAWIVNWLDYQIHASAIFIIKSLWVTYLLILEVPCTLIATLIIKTIIQIIKYIRPILIKWGRILDNVSINNLRQWWAGADQYAYYCTRILHDIDENDWIWFILYFFYIQHYIVARIMLTFLWHPLFNILDEWNWLRWCYATIFRILFEIVILLRQIFIWCLIYIRLIFKVYIATFIYCLLYIVKDYWAWSALNSITTADIVEHLWRCLWDFWEKDQKNIKKKRESLFVFDKNRERELNSKEIYNILFGCAISVLLYIIYLMIYT